MPNTLKHPMQFGNASINSLVHKRVTADFDDDDTAQACLKLRFSEQVQLGGDASATPYRATYSVDGDGAGTQGRLTINIKNHDATGSDNSDVSFTIDFDGSAKSDWSSGAAVAYSLKELIDLINETDAGGTNGKMLRCIKAEIGPGGRYDMVLNGADQFIDESATEITHASLTQAQSWTECLKRDMDGHTEDSDYLWYYRLHLGGSETRARLKLLDLWGAIGTNTGCTVYVIRDDDWDYVTPGGTWATDFANHDVVYEVSAANLPANPGTSSNSMIHNPNEAASVRGPLLVVVKGDTGGAQTITMNAQLQADIISAV